jgi:hypothetical protein
VMVMTKDGKSVLADVERLSEKTIFHNLWYVWQIRHSLYKKSGALCGKLIQPISTTNNGPLPNR